MPLKQTKFEILKDNLQEAIDVDASDGRSVPINMNFTDEGYLTKDTGIELFGDEQANLFHDLFNYKKKDGTSYILGVSGGILKKYNTSTMVFDNINIGTATITIASPGVVTSTSHGLKAGSRVIFSTTGALPTGITAGTVYFVISTGLSTDDFQFSETEGGTAVNTSGTQSGVHTITRGYGTDAEFGYLVYDDILYLGNAVDYMQTFDGTTITEFPGNPKGNIFEVFEDRVFVAGVILEPYTAYYSNVGIGTAFTSTDLVKPLGTDKMTNLKNYYGSLIMFKEESIWKLTFNYDQIVSLFVPKIDSQSGTYGACSRKAVSWVENDLWFFTGREVRALGVVDNISGNFGINKSVISESIKETIKLIPISLYSKVAVFYNDRKFYLAIPLETDVNDTLFVCHTLYKNSWTKYTGRDKAHVNDFMVIDDDIYTTKSSGTYGAIKWTDSLNDISTAISSEVFFRRFEDKEFNRFRVFRYLNLKFKDLLAAVTVTLRQEASDISDEVDKTFSVGNGTIGETIGDMLIGDTLFGGGADDVIEYSPFVKKKVSFLSKNQSFIIGLSNSEVDETFTICEFSLTGMEQPKKEFSSSRIISMN